MIRRIGIVVLVLNLMILSSWEGISLMHSLLHSIPNPFHHHHTYPVYHHGPVGHGHTHAHSHDPESHDFKDHFSSSLQEDQKQPVPEKDTNDCIKEFFKLKANLPSLTYWGIKKSVKPKFMEPGLNILPGEWPHPVPPPRTI